MTRLVPASDLRLGDLVHHRGYRRRVVTLWHSGRTVLVWLDGVDENWMLPDDECIPVELEMGVA